MGGAAKRGATYEDLLAVPETMIAEIVDGVLYTQARPASPHARSASRLGVQLGGPFDLGNGGPGGWIILDEPELHLHGGNVFVPDLAGWCRERMPEMPHAAAFELAPDWVCEVVSPSSTATDRAAKMPVYARERVPFAWIVDPLARTLEAYRLEGTRWLQLGVWRDDDKVRAEPFDAIELELAALWAR